MFRVLDKKRLERTRQLLRGEKLHKLKFEDAFRGTLEMMALLINMTRTFMTPSEFRRLPDHCGSLPAFPKRDEKKAKSPGRGSRRRGA
jgi:hypothetical protein